MGTFRVKQDVRKSYLLCHISAALYSALRYFHLHLLFCQTHISHDYWRWFYKSYWSTKLNVFYLIQEVLTNWPPWVQYITCFSHLLTVLNCSVNFYIYFLKQVNRKKRRRFFSTPEMNLIQVQFLNHVLSVSRQTFAQILSKILES